MSITIGYICTTKNGVSWDGYTDETGVYYWFPLFDGEGIVQ
jgi:hypothetical protein